MRAPHLLRVDDGPQPFAPLLAALKAAGLRTGWLALGPTPPASLPPDLASAVALGALRAVAVGPGASVAVKALRGRPVLRDLLREHFLGCALVLVQGDLAAPALHPVGDSWRVSLPDTASRLYRTDQLVAALRRPHPWLP
ncbi:MAG TPA: hypothetical protein VHQ90_25425 [Thermoanaerobaculia bacterium]|nr:hypothetical protein [Thermoanaerobaculia bacterium]